VIANDIESDGIRDVVIRSWVGLGGVWTIWTPGSFKVAANGSFPEEGNIQSKSLFICGSWIISDELG